MDIQLTVPDASGQNLSTQARDELKSVAQTFAQELLNEASRLEAASRSDSGKPEITRTMVRDAALSLRRFPTRQRHSGWHTFLQIVSATSTFLTGLLFDLHSLRDPNNTWGIPLFVFALTIAITSTTAYIMLGRNT